VLSGNSFLGYFVPEFDANRGSGGMPCAKRHRYICHPLPSGDARHSGHSISGPRRSAPTGTGSILAGLNGVLARDNDSKHEISSSLRMAPAHG